eukprot:1157763-Pelagomonas_calceolata.AAC.1
MQHARSCAALLRGLSSLRNQQRGSFSAKSIAGAGYATSTCDSTSSAMQHQSQNLQHQHQAQVLDGRRVASQWIEELASEVQQVTDVLQRPPGKGGACKFRKLKV